jgi:hypothetical protein
MAQEMGARLGEREVLLREMSIGQVVFFRRVEVDGDEPISRNSAG